MKKRRPGARRGRPATAVLAPAPDPSPARWRWPPRLWLLVILAVGAVLRVYRHDALDLWLDEGITVHVARLPWSTVLGFHGAHETHPPLYFVAVKLVTLLVPELRAGRVVSVIAGTATIPVLYCLASRLVGARTALIASAALALSPLHVWYSQEARMYALGTLLIAASYLAVVAFWTSPRPAWAAAYGAATLLAMYANYGAFFALAPQIALLAVVTHRHHMASLPLWVAGGAAAVGFLPWLPQLLETARRFGMGRESYLGVAPGKIVASVISIVGLGGSGSYFWGRPTPWDRWPAAQPLMVLGLALAIVAGTVAVARRSSFALAVVLALLPGGLAVAAGLSLLSPGYADRTVMFGVLGWAILLGALPFGLSGWLKWAGWAGGLSTVAVSLVTLLVLYRGADKQHWRQLAAHTARAADFGKPVWLYPPYTATLIDVYEPTLALRGRASDRDAPRLRTIDFDGGVPPPGDDDAIWLVYIETAGVDGLQRQLAERGYLRIMHRYHWNPMWLDLYAKPGLRWGREIPINGRFEGQGSMVDGWKLSDGRATLSEGQGDGRILHLTGPNSDSRAVTAAPARAEHLYIAEFDARVEPPSGRLRAFLGCASLTRWLEVAPNGEGASPPSDGQWHRVGIAAICPRETSHILLDLRNSGSGQSSIRHVRLREVGPHASAGTSRP